MVSHWGNSLAMTIKELKKELEKFDENLEIRCLYDCGYASAEISGLKFDEKSNEVYAYET